MDVWHPMMLEAAAEILRLRAENEKLRAALKPFAEAAEPMGTGWSDEDSVGIGCSVGDLRAAAAALKETGDE